MANKIILCAFLCGWSAFTVARALDCPRACDRPQDCRREYLIGSKKIDFYSNYPLSTLNSCIDTVVVVVHGTERAAESRYDAVLDAAKSVSRERNVLIISPFFKTDDDNPSSRDYYWSSGGWKQGNTSNNSGVDISSFAVVDAMLDTVLTNQKFPFVANATVTGHSAGGQFTQMYALTSEAPHIHGDIAFQFLVLNPSNYTYLNRFRPEPDYGRYFEDPTYWNGYAWRMKPYFRSYAGNCPNDFNDYKYGLDERNLYSQDFSNNELITQYLSRNVFYILGEDDDDPDHDELDTSCEATLQGDHRLERGKNYFNFLETFFPGHAHAIGIVPAVGHDARRMYDNNGVKALLFGV